MKHDCRSNIGRNIRAIMKYGGKPRICDITTKEVSKKSYQPVPNDKAWQDEVVKELIDVRDNKVDFDSWQKEEWLNAFASITTSWPSFLFVFCINIKSFVCL